MIFNIFSIAEIIVLKENNVLFIRLFLISFGLKGFELRDFDKIFNKDFDKALRKTLRKIIITII